MCFGTRAIPENFGAPHSLAGKYPGAEYGAGSVIVPQKAGSRAAAEGMRARLLLTDQPRRPPASWMSLHRATRQGGSLSCLPGPGCACACAMCVPLHVRCACCCSLCCLPVLLRCWCGVVIIAVLVLLQLPLLSYMRLCCALNHSAAGEVQKICWCDCSHHSKTAVD